MTNEEKYVYRWMATGCLISYAVGLLWLLICMPGWLRLTAIAVEIVGTAACWLAKKGS